MFRHSSEEVAIVTVGVIHHGSNGQATVEVYAPDVCVWTFMYMYLCVNMCVQYMYVG